jgi:hypothetical protein
MLLRLRDISNEIQKAKKYLKSGVQPPKGVKLHTGPKGGIYYNSEDLHAVRGTTPKKRLPAFRKQEDGSVMHRTKAGYHGAGAYKIHQRDDKKFQLSFTPANGGKTSSILHHSDIKFLKQKVAEFKRRDERGPLEDYDVKFERERRDDDFSLKQLRSFEGTLLSKIKDPNESDESFEKHDAYTDAATWIVDVNKHGGNKPGLIEYFEDKVKEFDDKGDWDNHVNAYQDVVDLLKNSEIEPKSKPLIKPTSSPLTSGDKRHDPDQKKIATGLGTTEKKKAKETVAEFGVDTRTKLKEIAENETGPVKSKQVRYKKLVSPDQDKPSLSRLREHTLNHPNIIKLSAEQRSEITRALDDMESTLSRSKSIDSFKRAITRKRNQIQKQPGYDMSNQGMYEQTLNTIMGAGDDWYYPEKVEKPVKNQKAKTKTSSHSLAELRIKQDMVAAGLDPESHDISSLMDKTLNYKENRANIAKLLGYSYTQKDKKEATQRADHHQCIQAQERCEVHGDSGACLQYTTMGCHKTYGPLDT